ncbi:MAG: DUF2141 domain-containing protein [Cyclobacteriaceae bacterium]|nr:DUF2141 domain-containing protein [Cyclobacteriaceae bacterium HetDA_MAG_MS6]
MNIAVLLLTLWSFTGESEARIQLTFPDDEGKVNIAFYAAKDLFLKEASHTLSVSISDTNMSVDLESVPDGWYAVAVFQDKNENSELDKTFVGIPKEPYGFSNNARGLFGPPSFEKCLVHVKSGCVIEISLL